MMLRLLQILAVLVLAIAPGAKEVEAQTTATHATAEQSWTAPAEFHLKQRDHPFLFADNANLQKIAGRAKEPGLPWAQKNLRQIIRLADKIVSAPLSVPDVPGEWGHNYVCKDCGIRLRYGGGKHKCPRCGREYTGWPYDGIIAAEAHHRNIHNGATLGLAYQLTGRREFAGRAREILLAYADRYTSFPIHDYKGTQIQTGARLFAQTLDEATAMIPMAWTYDLVYDAPGTSEDHRQHIENDLLRPAAAVICRNDMGISNWQSWHNAAIAAIGFVLNDEGMVYHAIHGKSGIYFQLQHSVLPDGFWYEGTAAYHFYALKALEYQALMLKAAGMDVSGDSKFKALYEAPMDYTFPDGRFPAVNDSDALSIFGQASHYEVAYSLYGDAKFGQLAAKSDRQSREAFLYGRDTLPAGDFESTGSEVFPGLGAVMLRQQETSNPLALHLDYGPHGGGHGHPDKLGIIFFANGHDVMPDAGRLQYGAPLHNRWYKTTLAHNTVIVDGKNQAAAEGRLVANGESGHVQWATAACDTAYKDVTLTRSVVLTPHYLLDVVSGHSRSSHTWDLGYHVRGNTKPGFAVKSRKLSEKSGGYQVLKNVRAGKPPTDWKLQFAGESAGLELQQADTGPVEVILADGLVDRSATACPVVLCRRVGTDVTWITLAVPESSGEVKLKCTNDAQGWSVHVSGDTFTDHFSFSAGEMRDLNSTSR